ncbi:Gag protein [Phytophthora palmivora]|uniref:Gag protein n=1 Tax=Phytophthora palmivora TaxID=4796 RepID=A0A2P4YVA7_9STRA|nr:Gag protein [Phytophthora palmivora]
MDERKPAQRKPLRLKVNPYEGKEGENLHFWVREVELVMDAALISAERHRVAFALSNLGGRTKIWAYTRETTTPGCFTTWDQLCDQLIAAFLPGNYEYRQRSRLLSCKPGKRELHEYIQEMWVLVASLVGISLPEHIKVTLFTDGLKVGPSSTRLFRVSANTMEEAIQIALQEGDIQNREAGGGVGKRKRRSTDRGSLGRDDASMEGDDATEEEEDVDEDVEGASAEEEDAENISAEAGETEGATSEVEGAGTHAEGEREQEG